MSSNNVCRSCIGKNSNECCVDVFIILNTDEVYLFRKDKNGKNRRFKEVIGGGIFHTTQGCPYFKDKRCSIHQKKPFYCKYYPIFITGKPFIDDECSIHGNYKLTESIKKEIFELQHMYSIYERDWFWEEVKKELEINTN